MTNFFWEGDTVGLELNEQYQPLRKYITGANMDEYEGHIECSEVTDWAELFNFSLGNQLKPGMYSYMKDQVGTIYKVYNHGDFTIAETRAYDTFGNLMSQTGTPKTNLGFQGKYYDAESGLYYFYQRYYNPIFGRFTTEDPIGIIAGINMYKAIENDPVEVLDQYGLTSGSFLWPRNKDISTGSWWVSKWGGGSHGKCIASLSVSCGCECDKDTGKWKLTCEFSLKFRIEFNLDSWKALTDIKNHEYKHVFDWHDWYNKEKDRLEWIEINHFDNLEECKYHARKVQEDVEKSAMQFNYWTQSKRG